MTERRGPGRPPGATRLKTWNETTVAAIRERLAIDPDRSIHDIAVELADLFDHLRSSATGGGGLGVSREGDIKRIKRLWAQFGGVDR